MNPPFLTELARPRPDPGGGAAAAYSARVALALMEKVVQLELQRHNSEEESRRRGALLAQVRNLTADFTRLQQEDVEAYFLLTRARAAGEPQGLAAAVRQAIACPGHIMEQAAAALGLLAQAGADCKKHLVSDLLVACELLAAALRGAHHIACANLPLLKDNPERGVLAQELSRIRQGSEALYQAVTTRLLERGTGRDRGRG